MTAVHETIETERVFVALGLRDPRAVLGRAIGATGTLLALYGLAALLTIGRADHITQDFVLHGAVWAIGFGSLAWLAMSQRPGNRAVWVAALAGLSSGIGTAAWATAILSTHLTGLNTSVLEGWYELTPAQVPTFAAVCWMVAFVGLLGGFFLIVTFGLLLFPGGSLPTPRWRWVGWASAVLISLVPTVMAWEWHPASNLPYGRGAADFTGIGRLSYILLPLLMSMALLSLAALVVGFRRSTGISRQQYKWVGLGCGTFVVLLGAVMLTQSPVPEMEEVPWQRFPILAGIVVLIASYAIAVTRYRLYDIDLVVNRTVVFVLLAGFITVVYAVMVVGLGRLVGGEDGLVLPVIATAMVAVAFEPVRQRAQRWANRMVYGRRATPYEVLSDLTARLAAAEEGEGILTRMASLLREGTGADRATVWLGPPGEMEPAASWPGDAAVDGSVDLEADGVFPVLHDGELVGALEVVKPRGNPLTHAEVSLVSDLAGSAGLVLGYQRLNESLAQRAREVEESRLRLVDAQDEERRRLERELRDGAQQLIVELRDKAMLASRLAREHQAEDLGSLLDGVAEEAETALGEVRSLAKGIYPPVLQSDGLAAAVAGLAAGAPVEVVVNDDGIGRYPPDIEAAVYFDVSEAITNAVKHAKPPIRVDLVDRDGSLRFVVTDTGPGFDLSETNGGSGLENMRDRLDAVGGQLGIDSHPGGETRVIGEIALRQARA